MTDLLKKLAEIEGITRNTVRDGYWEDPDNPNDEWNPLPLALVKKYKVDIYCFDDGDYGASCNSPNGYECNISHADLDTAIYMAVVESHK